MPGTIYLLRNGLELLPMVETPYESEALLQGLLADHPALLAGEQMTDGSARRWLFITRESPISAAEGVASWYVDHLYLDQDGIPTLVEVKRSTDTRIRREVVGQMLDYAANAVTRWTVEEIRSRFNSTPDADERLMEFLDGGDPGQFWETVAVNLAGGRTRMVFVADEIPPELRRIVDFLASQLRSAEVYAIKVRNYQGASERALVPRLISTPKPSFASIGQVQWDEESFFRELARRRPECERVARRVFDWAREHMTDVWYGTGTKLGSCIPRLQLLRTRIYLFVMWTSGAVEMQFQYLRVSPFTGEECRREFVRRLN